MKIGFGDFFENLKSSKKKYFSLAAVLSAILLIAQIPPIVGLFINNSAVGFILMILALVLSIVSMYLVFYLSLKNVIQTRFNLAKEDIDNNKIMKISFLYLLALIILYAAIIAVVVFLIYILFIPIIGLILGVVLIIAIMGVLFLYLGVIYYSSIVAYFSDEFMLSYMFRNMKRVISLIFNATLGYILSVLGFIILSGYIVGIPMGYLSSSISSGEFNPVMAVFICIILLIISYVIGIFSSLFKMNFVDIIAQEVIQTEKLTEQIKRDY